MPSRCAILASMRGLGLSTVRVAVSVLILKVTVGVVLQYGDYFPPNFQADFLRGREPYFWGGYQWAFYAHVIAGPASLLLGTILVSNWLRSRALAWHRRLGRIQVAIVLLLLVPS